MESLQYKRNEGPTTKTPSELKPGELAIDLVDGTIYYGKADNTIGRAGGLYQIHHSSSDTIDVSGDGRIVPLSFKFKISAQPGNLLESRGGGVGVWSEPPEELANLYVDVSGSDDNIGSRDAPLKTITAAFEKIIASPSQGRYIVSVKAGTTQILDKSFNLENKSIQIVGYGDSKYGDSWSGACSHYYPLAAADYNRPIIKVQWVQDGGEAANLHVLSSRSVRLQAVVVDVVPNNTGKQINPSGTIPFHGISTLTYSGCIFRRPHERVVIASAGSFETSWFQIVNYDSAATTPGRYTDGIVAWMHLHDGGQSVGACGSLPAYTEISGNVYQLVKYYNVSTGVEWDVPSRTLFGCTVNWNLFT